MLFSGLAVDLEISIHALREEGDVRRRECGEGREISIHALREEGDVVDGDRPRDVSISIHALREEGDRRRRCAASWA